MTNPLVITQIYELKLHINVMKIYINFNNGRRFINKYKLKLVKFIKRLCNKNIF